MSSRVRRVRGIHCGACGGRVGSVEGVARRRSRRGEARVRTIGTPSPAMAVAVIALFVALGGSGYAARQSAGGGGDRASAAAKKKVKRGPRGRRGPQGLQGPAGNTGGQGTPGTNGANGTNGTNGTNGNPAFGAVLGRGVITVGTGTFFLAPSGQSDASSSENSVDSFTPNATMTASDLAIAVFDAPAPGSSRRFTLSVGHADTALTCTVPGGTTTCTSTGSVTIPGGSLISMKSETSGGGIPTFVRFGWRATSA